jgi:hypothetical protein
MPVSSSKLKFQEYCPAPVQICDSRPARKPAKRGCGDTLKVWRYPKGVMIVTNQIMIPVGGVVVPLPEFFSST